MNIHFIKFLLFLALTIFSLEKSLADDYLYSQRMDEYLQSISSNPKKLYSFFQKIPKGGDLHNHLAGDSYAENLLKYELHDPVCIDNDENVKNKTCNCTAPANILKNKKMLSHLIDTWSMKDFDFQHHKGNDHFFSVFDKFLPILIAHTDLILAEAVNNASIQHEKYLELMITPDHGTVSKWGKQVGWTRNFSRLRNNLLKSGLAKDVLINSQIITSDENRMRKILVCDKFPSKSVCKIQVTYLYQVFREQSPEEVFSQLLCGFELSSKDSRVVGINLVQPEDGNITLRDYNLQMKMLAFFHRIYPSVKIALHAGELSPEFSIKNKINNHIRNAVKTGYANRIGHGTDIIYEKNYKQVLQEMRLKNIPVEINLTSNADILGVAPKDNPLPIYLKYNIPIIISTDDEGVLRTNLSREYLIAFVTFKLNYKTLKDIDRNSLTYSFLSGKSLWDSNYTRVVKECRLEHLGSDKTSIQCHNFLKQNKKAFLQWKLERDLHEFEENILNLPKNKIFWSAI